MKRKSGVLTSVDLSFHNERLLFVACAGGVQFAQSVKCEYESLYPKEGRISIMGCNNEVTRIFPDTETCAQLPCAVAGTDAYVFQCVHSNFGTATVNENIQQLLQVVRALRTHRAKSITVVTPYSPYSRQDKPTFMKREGTYARLLADQLRVAGANAHLVYHPHTMGLYGFYEPDIRFVPISGLNLFYDVLKNMIGDKRCVVVATDAGGAKFTIHLAKTLFLSYAIGNKFRGQEDRTDMIGIIGDISGKSVAIIADDETVTGGSIANTIRMLSHDYGIGESHVLVSHFKVREQKYWSRFEEASELYGLKKLHVTDSIPQCSEYISRKFVVVHKLARYFAIAISALHHDRSVSAEFQHDI